jgi:hypothetical protein
MLFSAPQIRKRNHPRNSWAGPLITVAPRARNLRAELPSTGARSPISRTSSPHHHHLTPSRPPLGTPPPPRLGLITASSWIWKSRRSRLEPRTRLLARPSLLALRELWEGPAARRREAPSTDGGGHPLPPVPVPIPSRRPGGGHPLCLFRAPSDPLHSPKIPRSFVLLFTGGGCPRAAIVMKSSA